MAAKVKNKGGRPRKEVDFDKIDALCQYHCTAQEIIAHLQIFDYDISQDTIERRIKERFNSTFAEYIEQKHNAHAKPTLRKWQWAAAEKGNPSMLIWLGKQYLQQSDKTETEARNLNVNFTAPSQYETPEEWEASQK